MSKIILKPTDLIDISEYTVVDEKDFDIEKWRVDSPMDYIKAIKMLNMSKDEKNKAEIFKGIYHLTRLYIPDVIYKYYSLNDNIKLNQQKLQTLKSCKVFLSDNKYLNDPFDSKAMYYNPSLLRKYKELSKHKGKLIDDFSRFQIGTSFSTVGFNSQQMWAHYSNNHQGYCVSYNTKRNKKMRSVLFPIQYQDSRIDVTPYLEELIENLPSTKKNAQEKLIEIDNSSLIYMTILLSNIKETSWNYEKEFRLSLTNLESNRYCEATPESIYIGKDCSCENEKLLISIGSKLDIPVFRMEYNYTSERFLLDKVRISS